ncbi:MAG: TldD/PmbA family protein [Thermoleophilia bacterium]|nr:TldD/PmbA family protein [Thermoleophilia bacterium]
MSSLAELLEVSIRGFAPDLSASLLKKALSRGGERAELFAEERHHLALRLEDSKIEDVSSGIDRGASLRLLRGGATLFAHVDAVDEAPLLSLALRLSELAGQGALQREGEALDVSGGGQAATTTGCEAGPRPAADITAALGRPSPAGPRTAAVATPPAMAESLRDSVAAKAALLRLVDETARAVSPEVRQVIAVYLEVTQHVFVGDSEGLQVWDHRRRAMLAVTVMAQREGLIQTGRETLAQQGGVDGFAPAVVAALAREAAERAVRMLDSRPAPAEKMPVVLANGFGGVLFHEACGHGLEADYILKKTSVWEGKKGERVAGPDVTAYDDGVALGMWGSSNYDDEGVPCQRTPLIEEGVLTGYLTDRLRASRLGLPLTGNGRRQDYRCLPYPRMTNTYFAPGQVSPAEIIADTKRALYAKSLAGGEVNPATGDFVFAVSEAYLIENGRVTTPVRGATLIGNGLEVLQGIEVIANDLDVKAGMCGKEGQSVPVGTGQPTLRIRALTVGGTGV